MSAPLQQLLGALLIACVPVGIIVYARLLRHLREKGGRVETGAIALPDALLTLVLVAFLGLQAALVVSRSTATPAARITLEQVLPSAVFFLGALALLLAFLHVRGLSLQRFFGLHRLRASRAVILAFGFIAAAFPILLLVGATAQYTLGSDAKEQELIGIFREAAVRRDAQALAVLAFAAAFSQPLVEEVFFRGYFYAVGKRYIGGLASALGSALLFAAVHFNLTAFPALLVLALCFTLAYEVSGTILVPIGMHALFNSSQLLVLAWQAHDIPTP